MAGEPDVKIIEVGNAPDIAAAKQLVRDYVAWLGIDLSHQNFEAEMEAFPGEYVPPSGALLLAKVNGMPAGVVGLRPLLDDGICEMKRLWVAPDFNGMGLGRLLCEHFMAVGRRLGYSRVRLDTVARAEAANHLYKALGFKEIEPYCFNPQPDALFFERTL